MSNVFPFFLPLGNALTLVKEMEVENGMAPNEPGWFLELPWQRGTGYDSPRALYFVTLTWLRISRVPVEAGSCVSTTGVSQSTR